MNIFEHPNNGILVVFELEIEERFTQRCKEPQSAQNPMLLCEKLGVLCVK